MRGHFHKLGVASLVLGLASSCFPLFLFNTFGQTCSTDADCSSSDECYDGTCITFGFGDGDGDFFGDGDGDFFGDGDGDGEPSDAGSSPDSGVVGGDGGPLDGGLEEPCDGGAGRGCSSDAGDAGVAGDGGLADGGVGLDSGVLDAGAIARPALTVLDIGDTAFSISPGESSTLESFAGAPSGALLMLVAGGKEHVVVDAVTSPGLTWVEAVQQCSDRSQSGVSVFWALAMGTRNQQVSLFTATPVDAEFAGRLYAFSRAPGGPPAVAASGGNTEAGTVPPASCDQVGADGITATVASSPALGQQTFVAVSHRNNNVQNIQPSELVTLSSIAAGTGGNQVRISTYLHPPAESADFAATATLDDLSDWAMVAVDLVP